MKTNNNDFTVITVSLTKAERKAIKRLALDRDTTVSNLFRSWLREVTGMEAPDGGQADDASENRLVGS